MNKLLLPFLSYAFVTTFTPGPNNISASSLGKKAGFGGALPYLAGNTIGFFLVMLASGGLTDFLKGNYAQFSVYLKWAGLAYMGWLALSLLLPGAREQAEEARAKPGFFSGFLLQFVNPKVIIYGITVFTSFSGLLTGSAAKTFGSSLLLAAIGFCAVSLWALTGAALSGAFKSRAFSNSFTAVMVLLLVYSGISIIR